MIWGLSDTITERVIHDTASGFKHSVIKSEWRCFMLWVWAVNIHPWPLFYEAKLGLRIYLLKILQENFSNGQSA